MAHPRVIEARKAEALESMKGQLDRIEAKLDKALGIEPAPKPVEATAPVEMPAADEAPAKGKGKK